VLLSQLYKETVVKLELMKTTHMGPWTHKADEGMDACMNAYKMMYTVLDTCRLDLHEFLIRVIVGPCDDSDEVKVLAHMTLFRLAGVAPA